MSRHHDTTDTLDPAVAAELEALDAALSGADDPEWAALVAAVRDEAPAPAPRAARELDQRVAAGFPRARPGWLRLPALHVAVPALACLVLLLGVGGVVVSGGVGGDGTQTFGSADSSVESTATTAVPEAATGAGAASSERSADSAESSQAAPSRGSGIVPPSAPVPPGTQRRVERTTSLDLTTDADGLQDAADGIVRATQDLGGVVETSQVERSPEGGQASFALRVPTARLPEALKRFGALADIARLSEGSQDVTGTFVSAQSRLSDARAERKALLASLGRATTDRSIASLRARLRGNRAEIARLEGELRSLRRRTATSRVDVALSASGAAVDPGAGGAWGPRDAARDALRVLEVLAGGALVIGAVLLPLLILGLLWAGAGAALRRRRREAALGAG